MCRNGAGAIVQSEVERERDREREAPARPETEQPGSTRGHEKLGWALTLSGAGAARRQEKEAGAARRQETGVSQNSD